MEFKKILVVIPSRNRADFAVNAINSVLSQQNCRVELLVSDNSTDHDQVEKLSSFCNQLEDKRLSYTRPPQSLPMTEHWDWIMEQALPSSTASHFTILSDRTIYKKNALEKLEKAVKLDPSKVVAFFNDEVHDDVNPVTLRQIFWTGKVYEVKSSYMLQTLASSMMPTYSTPRMSNCCVPKHVLQTVKSAFGRYFSSVAPDYNFAFSFFSLFDSVLYYDIPLILSYGMDRSNGNNSSKGVYQKDVKDFQSQLGEEFKISFASPIDSILPFINAVLHEYFIIKNANSETKTKFPEIDRWMYLRTLMGAILTLENPRLRKNLLLQFYKSTGKSALAFHLRAKYPVKKMLTAPFAAEKADSHKEVFILKKLFQNRDEAIKYDNDFPREKSLTSDYLSIKLGIAEPDGQNVKLIKESL